MWIVFKLEQVRSLWQPAQFPRASGVLCSELAMQFWAKFLVGMGGQRPDVAYAAWGLGSPYVRYCLRKPCVMTGLAQQSQPGAQRLGTLGTRSPICRHGPESAEPF
jgi:hypothetical protein